MEKGAGTIARPFIPWVGGKEKLAPYILQVLPPNPKVYVEPFGGSGAILLGLDSSAKRLDVYNDFDADLVNLFLCTKERLLRLLKELNYLPLHSRAEFEMVKASLQHQDYPAAFDYSKDEVKVAEEMFSPEDAAELTEILQGRAELMDVRRAAAYFKLRRGSFSGTGTSFGIKPCNVRAYFYLLCEASRRLEDVVIENKDAPQLIRDMDGGQVLFYNDPPYFEAEQYYSSGFAKEDHIRLHDTLTKCSGYHVVSYNDCSFIRALFQDFFILAFSRSNPLAQRRGAVYHELIMTNFDPRAVMPQMNLFELSGGYGDMELVHIPDKPLKMI